MAQVVKVWCEWEIGTENAVYATVELARADVVECLKNCGIDDPIDELEDEGLVSFEWIESVDTDARYRLVSDDDGHNYIIPADKTKEWDAFVDDPDEFDGEPPEWAEQCPKHPSALTFTNPEWT